MSRLFTHAFAGQGFLNFIGNEFGHPDWVELPSPSNNDNYQFARRQFHLADNQQMRYKYLNRFDRAINKTEERFGWLKSNQAVVTRTHKGDKVMVFERAGLVFVFNFHPTKSYSDYKIPVRQCGSYKIMLDTDDNCFGGHSRNQANVEFHSRNEQFENSPNSMMIYLPSRSGMVLAQSNLVDGYKHSGDRRGSYYGTEQNRFKSTHNRNVHFNDCPSIGYSQEVKRIQASYNQDNNRRSYGDGNSMNQDFGYNGRQQYW
uniref:Alpha-amylase/branching enzyme C-terminal all beta domain-containing protein n=2 Tax=Ciona savignyi TaxID=51511 RepID=H2Z7D6_CIOSA